MVAEEDAEALDAHGDFASEMDGSESDPDGVAWCGLGTWIPEHDRIGRIFEEERRVIGDRMRSNGVPETPLRFSVAFSGGGMRAAAFQSGVLWRLAQTGQIKNVEYLSAVSGGAYIASAFASHAQRFEREDGLDGRNVDECYRTIVARTILQMQENAGNFVRDPFSVSLRQAACPSGRLGPGLGCPKLLDLPVLIGTLLVTLSSFPLICLLFILIPTVEFIEMFFGSAMRGAFCAASDDLDWYIVFRNWSPWGFVMYALQVLIPLTFACWLILKLLAPAPPPLGRDKDFASERRPSRQLLRNGSTGSFSSLRSMSSRLNDDEDRENREPLCHLFFRSTLAVLIRLTILILLLVSTIAAVTFLHMWAFTTTKDMQMQRQSFCMRYINSEGMDMDNASAVMRCANQHLSNASSWYDYPAFRDNFNYSATYTVAGPIGPARHLAPNAFWHLHQFLMHNGNSLPTMACAVLVIVLSTALMLAPFIPGIFVYVLFFAGPGLFGTIVLAVLQYRVYGPLTDQRLLQVFHFNRNIWETFCWRSLVVVVFIVMPFYHSFRSIFHSFYRRTLKINFFCDGLDVRMVSLKRSLLVPFLLFTGTVNDYIRPGDSGQHHSTTEISLSPLHVGSETTGYIKMPHYQTLSKCTALTGAGGVDAISLSLNDGNDLTSFLQYRFWLEILSLSWGDYILFLRHRNEFIDSFSKQWSWLTDQFLEKNLIWGLYRTPALICIFSAFGLQCYAWSIATFEPSPENCLRAKDLMLKSLLLSILIVSLSFFSFAPPLRWLSFEPILRSIQQMSQFAHCGQQPPGLLYVTDGGAFDCTTLLQLTKRRCKRILLVLAAMDPDDEFGVLLAAFQEIVNLKIGSFYDPRNPHNCMEIMIEKFKEDRAATHMEVGISYGWEVEPCEEHGTIWIVKNRMPEARRKEQRKLPNLLDEDTLLSTDEPPSDDEREDVDLLETEMGGLGCCSCCHFGACSCNCGRKFPQLTATGYLWLTPEIFNSLCRLGHALSEKAIQDISARDPPSRSASEARPPPRSSS